MFQFLPILLCLCVDLHGMRSDERSLAAPVNCLPATDDASLRYTECWERSQPAKCSVQVAEARRWKCQESTNPFTLKLKKLEAKRTQILKPSLHTRVLKIIKIYVENSTNLSRNIPVDHAGKAASLNGTLQPSINCQRLSREPGSCREWSG